MSNDDVTQQTSPSDAPPAADQEPYTGRHAGPGEPDQGPDEDATYDARHDDVDGPPGAAAN